MQRREFLVGAATGAVAMAGLGRTVFAQSAAASAKQATLARISIMTLNFVNELKLPGQSGAERTLDVLDIPQMYADKYDVHNIEFQFNHIPSTEKSYWDEMKGRLAKTKSRITQFNLEFETRNITAGSAVLRLEAIDLTKRWVDHAVYMGVPRVMVNQGAPSEANRSYGVETLKTMGEYAKSKGVKVSMETRGGGGGGRGRAGAPGAGGVAAPMAAPVTPAPPSAPAWVLLSEFIKASGTYSNVDIGGVGAPDQDTLHKAIATLLPTSSGNMHIKTSPNWDLPTALKYVNNELGYKGLFSIEANTPNPTAPPQPGNPMTQDPYKNQQIIYDVLVANM